MVKQVHIGDLKVGSWIKPVFIAEIGINHNGSYEQALQLTDAAIEAGADIVKFQHHLPDYEMINGHVWLDLMQHCQLDLFQLQNLKDYIEGEGKEFLCTPFCAEAATELNSIDVHGFKTGSGECNHIPFQQHVARFGKPLLISTGMTSRAELFATVDSVLKINPQVILLNCTSTYPATIQEARLKRIEWLKSTFNLAVGHSDHTPSISTAVGAIASGAVCIEKHFTLDKNWLGPDQSASILPSEFKQMVTMGLEIWEGLQMCTESEMEILDREASIRYTANHSIVAKRDIRAGEIYTTDNLTTMRPGTGLPASELNSLIGRAAYMPVSKGDILPKSSLR
jgi:sialic acid synthase SpsE